MKKNSSKASEIKNASILVTVLPYILLLCISILPFFSFFHSGLPLTHDGKDHVARIANFYQSLQEGIIIPRWAANLNWGYGHPILMFLYPFPSYFASFIHFLGFSFVDSVKIVFGVSYILSGFTMYLWVSKIFHKYAGFVAALVYLFAPYRFVDIHVRGAFGENVAFIFPPLILYFLYKLSQKRDTLSMSLAAVSLSGLLLSHNAISIMFLPIFILYAVYLFFITDNKKQFLVYTIGSFMLGFLASSFFIIPALLEGKYTLRDIVTSSDYATRFVPFGEFIYGQWSFGGTDVLSKQIGIVQWLFAVASIYAGYTWYKKKNDKWWLAVGSLVVFSLSLFIMTAPSKIIWDHITILKNFQFPWRFLTVSVFICAFCSGFVMTIVPKQLQLYKAIGVGVALLLLTMGYWGVNGYIQKPDTFYSTVYEGTTDTGESAPIWSVRFMEKTPKAPLEVIEGKASITSSDRKTTKHTYTVTASEKTRLRENTLYFPGWEVLIDNKEVIPEFQDPKNRGLMTFFVEKGTHDIQIDFKETKIRLISDYLSIFAVFLMGVFCIMNIRSLWKHFQ